MKEIPQVCKSFGRGKTQRLEEERKWKSQEEEPGKCKSTVGSEKEVIFKLQWMRNQ